MVVKSTNINFLKKAASFTGKSVMALGLLGTVAFCNEQSNGSIQQYLGRRVYEVAEGKPAQAEKGFIELYFDKKVEDFILGLQLPPVENTIADIYERQKRGNITLLDKHGDVFAEVNNRSKTVSYSRISPNIIMALVYAEDKRFYEHHGWDLGSTISAAFNNYKRKHFKSHEGDRLRGASTITIQLADNLLENDPNWIKNKLMEWSYAAALEKRYTKNEIITHYLNSARFGFSSVDGQALVGVEAAANYYFGKPASDIDLLESSVLVAILNSPTAYGTHAYDSLVNKNDAHANSLKRLRERAAYVLDEVKLMCDVTIRYMPACENQHFDEFKKRLNYFRLNFEPHISAARSSTYEYTAEVLQLLSDIFKMADTDGRRYNHFMYDDITVKTPLDQELQKYARERFTESLAKIRKSFAKNQELVNGGVIVLNTSTGGIEALVGGTGIDEGDFLNRTTLPYLAPGSGFKPFVLWTALRAGMRLEDTIVDEPRTYKIKGQKDYKPREFKHKHTYKPITLEEAFVHSVNGVFVELGYRIQEEVYPGLIFDLLNPLNLNIEDYFPSTPLGTSVLKPLDFAAAYSIFANGGRSLLYNSGETNATFIEKVFCSHNAFVNEHYDIDTVTPKEYTAMDRALRGVVKRGSGMKASIEGYDVRGKTGTGRTSFLFVGHEPLFEKVVLVFFASDKPEKTGRFPNAFNASEYAAPLAGDIMKYIAAQQQRPYASLSARQ